MSGPMQAAIQRLYERARERQRHYQELGRTAGTPGRREHAEQLGTHYARIARHLAEAAHEAERTP